MTDKSVVFSFAPALFFRNRFKENVFPFHDTHVNFIFDLIFFFFFHLLKGAKYRQIMCFNKYCIRISVTEPKYLTESQTSK